MGVPPPQRPPIPAKRSNKKTTTGKSSTKTSSSSSSAFPSSKSSELIKANSLAIANAPPPSPSPVFSSQNDLGGLPAPKPIAALRAPASLLAPSLQSSSFRATSSNRMPLYPVLANSSPPSIDIGQFNTLPVRRLPPKRPPLPLLQPPQQQQLLRADTLPMPKGVPSSTKTPPHSSIHQTTTTTISATHSPVAVLTAASVPAALGCSTIIPIQTSAVTLSHHQIVSSSSASSSHFQANSQRRLLLWPQSAVGHQNGVETFTAVQLIPTLATTSSSTSFPSERTSERFKQQQQREKPSKLLLNSLQHSTRMACCFCCCPVYRCVLWFCAFELICSFYFWYYQLSELVRTYSTIQLKDILLLLILSGWLLTLCVSTVSLFIAQRKEDPQWVLPRLVQQSGLLILGFLMALFLVIYFIGGAQSINNVLISIYESIYSEKFTREQRQDAHEDLRLFFLCSILGTFFFLCYISAALCATKKYYREMQITGGRQFQRVNQHDPTAPPRQPAVNPNYKGRSSNA